MAKQINVLNEKTNVGQIIISDTVYNNSAALNILEPLTSSLPPLAATFVGREDKINELNKLIIIEKQKMVIVSGFSGFGKSEFVKRFVFAHKYQCNILWINSESEENIRNSFVKIFNIKSEDYNEVLTKTLCQSLKKKTFIIFDNAPNREHIRQYEVDSETIHYIVTSNTRDWENHISVIILDVLTEEAALQIFRAKIINEKFKEEDEETYKKIAKSVSYVPLTLAIVASYLYQEMSALSKQFVLQRYLHRLEKPKSDNYGIIENLPTNSTEAYKKSFYVALKTTIGSIEEINNKTSKLALTIINICAFMFSDRITYRDFFYIPYFKKQLDNNEITECDIRRACHNLLRNYCLININSDEESFQVHNLIQNTLKYHQICFAKHNTNIYFYNNLEILMDINNTSFNHSNAILSSSSNMMNTFQNFLTDYYTQISNSPDFCCNLIFDNSHLYLKEIFYKMGNVFSKNYINSYFLLHFAVISQHYNGVELLINWGADVDLQFKQRKNMSPLMWAAQTSNLEIIQLLINKNCQVNTVDGNNDNIFFHILFAMNNRKNKHKSKEVIEILRMLVDKEADITKRGWWNRSLLHVAAKTLNIDILEYLIYECKLNVNALDREGRTPIFYISHSEDTDRKRRLMAAKCLVHSGTDLKLKNEFGKTAADEAHDDGVEYLYEYYTSLNPDHNFTDVEENQRADELLRAVVDGNLDAVRHLFEELGEQSTQLAQSCQALYHAIIYEKHQILEFLLDHNVPVNSWGKDNRTILHTAAEHIDFHAIKILVERGIDIKATNTDGWSVLSFVILGVNNMYEEDNACDVLKWLVEKGADPKHVDNNKSTLVHTATCSCTPRILRCLVQDYGLNINAVNTFGTALHNAMFFKWISHSEHSWWETVGCLIDLGARLDITDADGKTPAQLARYLNYTELADMLEKKLYEQDCLTYQAQRDEEQNDVCCCCLCVLS